MADPKCTVEEFAAVWQREGGNLKAVAKVFGMDVRNAAHWRTRVLDRLGIDLQISDQRFSATRRMQKVEKIGHRITATCKDGIAVIFGDAHYWPGDKPVAHAALVRFIKKVKPKIIVCNGDSFDGARIGRHPPTGWARMPEVADELAYCQQMLAEIEQASTDDAKLLWNMGNHDSRFSMRLAQVAPEFVRVHGVDLPDHFPNWAFAWSTFINENVVIKHRYHQGIHATWNNTLKSGMTICTNHLHRLAVTPITDYNGRRYGVDCGTLSDFGPEESKFTYAEDNPFNWASGFGVLTFKNGRLLPPELAIVQDGVCLYRGEPI